MISEFVIVLITQQLSVLAYGPNITPIMMFSIDVLIHHSNPESLVAIRCCRLLLHFHPAHLPRQDLPRNRNHRKLLHVQTLQRFR
jgi:hypothetical protein